MTTEQPGANPTQQPPPEQPTPATAPGQNSGENGQTFTQADLERILGERLKRAEESNNKKFLEALGIDSLDTAKKLIAAQQQREESEKTELQKLQEKLAAAESATQEAQAQALAAQQERMKDKRDSAIMAAFRESRSSKPDAVLILMEKSHSSLIEAVADKDGKIDEGAMKTLVETARKTHPELFGGSGPGSPTNRNGQPPQPDKAAKDRAAVTQNTVLRRTF